MHIYTKTKAEHQSTDVNKVRSWGYMCTHLTANVLSSPYCPYCPKAVCQRNGRKCRSFRGRQSLLQYI